MQKHEKEEINRSMVLESFSCVFLFSLLSRLDESRHKVSLQLITIDYTVKVLFFLTPHTLKINSICCQLLLHWLPGLRF